MKAGIGKVSSGADFDSKEGITRSGSRAEGKEWCAQRSMYIFLDRHCSSTVCRATTLILNGAWEMLLILSGDSLV